MIEELPTLEKLLRQLQRVPYLASKNLYRVVEYFLEMDPAHLEEFSKSLLQAKSKLVKCKKCFSWHELEKSCIFCKSRSRNHSLICVVQTWYDLYIIEKTGGYNGEYHVLGGVMSPLDGMGPEDLTIKELAARVGTDAYEEVILALSQTPEGEATSALIARKLEGKDVLITCLASGVSVGSSLEYTDRLTLHKAISERRVF